MPCIDSLKKTILNINANILVCLILVLTTTGLFWSVRHFDFINFDDTLYVTKNLQVQSGLNKESITWAFSFADKDDTYWHPLTWLSHMLDIQLYGMDSGRHHMTNVLFHIANALLLFLILNRITGSIWRSAFVAALFAIHPINVESVVWVAERKNVLSTFFWMLTLLSYAYYTEKPCPARYLLVFWIFALGLLAKPMLVTLPFILLLLDYWPLGRILFQRHNSTTQNKDDKSIKQTFKGKFPFRLILEKIPLLALSGFSVYLSSVSLQRVENFISLESVPMKLRISNALVSYVKYLGKMIWPNNLAVFYPYPKMLPMWQVIVSLFLIIGVSVLVIRELEGYPYLVVGWLWYLGTLIPVIGLAQVGLWPAMADRWAYVPFIGLYIIIAWFISDLLDEWKYKKLGLAFVSTILILGFIKTTSLQIRHWKNSIALYKHAIQVTSDNHIAHNNLGVFLAEQNRITNAIKHYGEAIRIKPNYAEAHYNIGIIFAEQNRITEAIKHYTEAIRIKPNYIKAHNNLGNTLIFQRKFSDAIQHYSCAITLDPDNAKAHNNLGVALMNIGKTVQAIHHFKAALKINPDYIDAQRNLKKAINCQKL